jgi:hypothetical protein
MDKLTVNILKKLCHLKKITKYSKLTKLELVKLIEKYDSVKKIQKWFRKRYNPTCPISLDKIKYPCFGYVPSRGGTIIYYNLEPLKNYLIKSGNFKDPNTREVYNEDIIKKIDCIDGGNELMKAFKNKRFYEKIKERELENLIIERELDRIVEELTKDISAVDINLGRKFLIETVYIISYRVYFKRMLSKDKEYAKYSLDKNISSLQLYNEKNQSNFNNHQKNDLEYFLCFLHELSFQEFNV